MPVANEANKWAPYSQGDVVEVPEGVNATDAAAAKAAELGVDLTTVTGTGADGRITVADVESAAG